MAVAHVASSTGYYAAGAHGNVTSAVNPQCTFVYTATGTGNLVLLWVTQDPTSTSSTTCSLAATGWTFTQIGGLVDGGTAGGVGAMFWAYAPNTSAATIVATWNQSGTAFYNDLIEEFSGMHLTVPIAGNNIATGTGTPTVSVTPTAANCMVWVPCNDTITAVGAIGGTTATKGADDTQQDWAEYRLLSGGSGSAQSCTFTGSGTYIIGGVAIQPPSSPPVGFAAGTLSAAFVYFDVGEHRTGA